MTLHPAISGLLIVLLISTIGGLWFSHIKIAEKPVKVMIFVGYFWLLAFIQLLLLASGYFLWQHFSN